jgi:tetratricopeptide (TPR) repeat protein
LKNLLLIVTVSAWLSACASVERPAQPVAPQPDLAESSAAADTTAPDAAESAGAEALPSNTLSSEILYKRGQWQAAYITTLGVAQQTRDPRIARRAAEIALTAKQPGEALAAVRLWHELAPHSEEATQYLLGFIVLSDKLDEAQPILTQRLQEASPKQRGLMMFQVQRILAGAKDKAAAFALLEQLLAPYLAMPEAHIALAQSAYNAGENGRAAEEAHTALRLQPDSELAILTLAQVTPDPQQAQKSIAAFIAAHPKAREVRLAYARMLVDQKQFDQARGQFETLLKAQPQDLQSLYALGILALQMKNTKAAEQYFTRYLDLLSARDNDEHDPSQVLLILAQIAEERGDTDAALRWLEKIDDADGQKPAWFNAQLQRAQLTAKRGDLAGAQRILAELKPESTGDQVQVVLADSMILREAGREPAAYAALEDGLKRFPNNNDLLYDYAMMAEKRNNLASMETSLRKIIAQAPNSQQAYNALGYALADRNLRLPEAFALIDTALKLAPDDPFIMDSMGWVQFRMGNLKQAEQQLRRAYALRPDPEIAVHLGEVLWAEGQKADAQQLWREVRSKDPKNDTLKSTLARLNVQL